MRHKISPLGVMAVGLVLLASQVACKIEGVTNTRFGEFKPDARITESGLHLGMQYKPPVAKGGNQRVYTGHIGINTERGGFRPYGILSGADENGL